MSTSGLWSCSSRTHEVGPVPMFVSEENPRGVVFSFSSCGTAEEKLAHLFAQPSVSMGGVVCPPSRIACLDGYELLTASILTENHGENLFSMCLIPGMAVTCL